MMNGLPLLGLDDYVHASDLVNENIDKNSRSYVMNSPVFRGQFGTFLGVRELQIRLSPDNCWTRSFVKHLRATSTMIKVR